MTALANHADSHLKPQTLDPDGHSPLSLQCLHFHQLLEERRLKINKYVYHVEKVAHLRSKSLASMSWPGPVCVECVFSMFAWGFSGYFLP